MGTSRLARVVLILIFGGLVVTVRAEPPAKLDVHGDALPTSAIARLGTIRFRHGDGASFVAFIPGGKELLTVGRDETARFWDVATGKELRHFRLRDETVAGTVGQTASGLPRPGPGFAGVASSSALSSDCKPLAYSTTVPPIRLFDVAAGKELRTIQTTRGGASILFAPDGKSLAVQDLSGPIRLYEVATGKEMRQLAPVVQEASRPTFMGRASMAFSADGKVLASASTLRRSAEQAPLIFWDTTTGKEIRRITTGADQVGRVGVRAPAFSPDGKVLAWIDGNDAVVLAEPSTGKEVRRLLRSAGGRRARGPGLVVGSLLFAPDSKKLAVFGVYDSSISVWDAETGKELCNFGSKQFNRPVNSLTLPTGRLAFSPDSKRLAPTHREDISARVEHRL